MEITDSQRLRLLDGANTIDLSWYLHRVLLTLVLLVACTSPTPAPSLSPDTAGPNTQLPSLTATERPANPSPTPTVGPEDPTGFPLPISLKPMRVAETQNGRGVVAAAENGPTLEQVAREVQTRPQNDMESNRYGWNCRLHDKYEQTGPAVDWYLPNGTPIATVMGGQAELYIITTANSYAYYGSDIRDTLGLPDPSVPLYPLPGPSGGMGIFVSVLNGPLRAEYGHLDLAGTMPAIPEDAFVQPFSRGFNYEARFGRPVDYRQTTLIARWTVHKGDAVGRVGNTGYSDVSHLHYQIVTADRQRKFCPTPEAFPYSGWLFGRPSGFPGR